MSLVGMDRAPQDISERCKRAKEKDTLSSSLQSVVRGERAGPTSPLVPPQGPWLPTRSSQAGTAALQREGSLCVGHSRGDGERGVRLLPGTASTPLSQERTWRGAHGLYRGLVTESALNPTAQEFSKQHHWGPGAPRDSLGGSAGSSCFPTDARISFAFFLGGYLHCWGRSSVSQTTGPFPATSAPLSTVGHQTPQLQTLAKGKVSFI